MIIGLQIIAILFSFTMIYFAILNFKRREINGLEIASWLTIWTATILIVIFPEFLKTFAKTFLFARVFDMMVVGAFILVIALASSAYIKTRRNEKKLEELVRKLSLRTKSKK